MQQQSIKSQFVVYFLALYELSAYEDGQFIGKLEQAFRISAGVYLE